MFQRIIQFSVSNPLIVGIGVLALVVWGAISLRTIPIDAVPDITNNQVQIVTLSPSLAPQEIERLITVPIEQTMATIDGVVERRSISRFGLSVVTLVFDDDVDLYWARAQVDERLMEAKEQIPSGMGSPTMMPITTGLGEIYQYTLHVDEAHVQDYSAMELRTIHDWMIRRTLLGTQGVADVASFGGYLKQVEVAVDPERLAATGLTMADVLESIQASNSNSGGAYIERGNGVAYVRTEGLLTSATDIELIQLKMSSDGLPVLVRDIGHVRDGYATRYGALTEGDSAEAVGGIVYMLKGANGTQVIERVKERIHQIEQTLPEGITVVPYLDRAELVQRTIHTVSTNLIEGALIVILVLVLLLGNFRAGIIVASVIPLSMLFAIGMMTVFNVSGNLMSLGAVDFGLVVDGAVILVEHVLSRLRHLPTRSRAEGMAHVAHAAQEIRRSASFGELIILMVYLPILALVGIEGKMFIPMAQTVMFAILGALILSLTYVPMMSALLLWNVKHTSTSVADRIMSWLLKRYEPMRRYALRHIATTLIVAGILLTAAVGAFLSMGGEFIPTLNEGDLAVELRLPTGSSLSETIAVTQRAAGILQKQFPEVRGVVGKIGTTEIPLDPMPLEACDLMVLLKPRSEWTSARNREELATKMQHALEVIPDAGFGFQQPIQMRFNELMTGAKQDVVVKVYGDDLATLAELTEHIGSVVESVAGATDVFVEPVTGLPQIVVRLDRNACALLGVRVEDVNTTVRAAFAGEKAGEFYEGERRFDVVVRLGPDDRKQLSDLQRLTVRSASGAIVPIDQVAHIEYVDGPNQIQREDGRRRSYVGFNVRDRDVQSIVDEVRKRMATIHLPPGYEVTFGGQFENLEHATQRLLIAVPLALLLILVLLYFTFGSITDTVIVFVAIPLSAIGGVAALLLRGMPFSISAGVGFIALFGVAVLNGIVLLASFKHYRTQHPTNTLMVVLKGTTQRLRPVIMTALVASLGFLPMALSTSDGAEVQRPLATVVIGGLISSTLLTLVVLPSLYFLVHRPRRRRSIAPFPSMIVLTMLLLGGSLCAQPTILPRDSIRALALRNNYDVRIALNAVKQAAAMRGTAVDLGPTSLEWMGGQYNAPYFDNNFTITQTIPWPGKLAAQASVLEEQERMAEVDARQTRRMVMVEVERAIDMIAYSHEMLSIMVRMDSVFARSARAVEHRVQAGDANELEQVHQQGLLSELRAKQSQLQADLYITELQLQMLCGDSAVTIADSVLRRRSLPSDTTLSNQLTASYTQPVRVAEAQSDAASQNFWPDIALGYSNQSLIGTPLTDGTESTAGYRFHYVTVELALPLWVGPTQARKRMAALELEKAQTEARRNMMLAEHERIKLLRTINALTNAVNHYDGPAQKESLALIEHSAKAYEAGSISWLELQQSVERAMSIARSRLETLLQYNEAIVQLATYTGSQP